MPDATPSEPSAADFTASLETALFEPQPDAPAAPEALEQPETPAPEQPAEQPENPETPEAPEPEQPAEPDDDEPAPTGRPGIKQMRLYAKTPEELEFLGLLKGGATMAEAQKIIAERQASRQAPDEPQGPDISALETELQQLDQRIEQAGEDGEVMTPELAKAIQRRSDLATDIRLAKHEAKLRAQEAERAAQSAYQQSFDESSAAVVELYPDAANPESAFSKALDLDVEKILSTPNHPLRENPEAPMILAVQLARRMKIAPATGQSPVSSQHSPNPGVKPSTPTAPATTPAATTPRPGLTPAAGSSRTAPQPAMPTAAQIEAELQSKLAAVSSAEEGAGLLAASLFGAAPVENPFG